jgi:protein-L-isoaspartate(D-aspartate) O-methyltransferase
MTDFAQRRVQMVDTQIRTADVTKFPIIAAMLDVPRESFVPEEKREAAYLGENVGIAPGRALLDPRSFAKLLDAADIQPHERVLIVGAGLGYPAAIAARIGKSAVALEENEALAARAEAALEGHPGVTLATGPLAQGWAAEGPYDAILFEGAVEEIPEAFAKQLTETGRMAAIFAEGALGTARIGYVTKGRLSWRFAFNASAPVLPGFAKAGIFAL